MSVLTPEQERYFQRIAYRLGVIGYNGEIFECIVDGDVGIVFVYFYNGARDRARFSERTTSDEFERLVKQLAETAYNTWSLPL